MRELSFQFGDMRKFWKGIVETVVPVVEVLTATEMHTYERLKQCTLRLLHRNLIIIIIRPLVRSNKGEN